MPDWSKIPIILVYTPFLFIAAALSILARRLKFEKRHAYMIGLLPGVVTIATWAEYLIGETQRINHLTPMWLLAGGMLTLITYKPPKE